MWRGSLLGEDVEEEEEEEEGLCYGNMWRGSFLGEYVEGEFIRGRCGGGVS